MFDDLILMSCGRLLYCGSWMAADTYFADAGFKCAARSPARPVCGWLFMSVHVCCMSVTVHHGHDIYVCPACQTQTQLVWRAWALNLPPSDAGSQMSTNRLS